MYFIPDIIQSNSWKSVLWCNFLSEEEAGVCGEGKLAWRPLILRWRRGRMVELYQQKWLHGKRPPTGGLEDLSLHVSSSPCFPNEGFLVPVVWLKRGKFFPCHCTLKYGAQKWNTLWSWKLKKGGCGHISSVLGVTLAWRAVPEQFWTVVIFPLEENDLGCSSLPLSLPPTPSSSALWHW